MNLINKEKPLFEINDIKNHFSRFGFVWDRVIINESGRPILIMNNDAIGVLMGRQNFLVYRKGDENKTPTCVRCLINNNTFEFFPYGFMRMGALSKSSCLWIKDLVFKNIENQQYCKKAVDKIKNSSKLVKDKKLKIYQTEFAKLLSAYLDNKKIVENDF